MENYEKLEKINKHYFDILQQKIEGKTFTIQNIIGNLDSKIVIILNNIEDDEDIINLYKIIFKEINIDFNNICFMSYYKIIGLTDLELQTKFLDEQIKVIKPSAIYNISDYICNIDNQIYINLDRNKLLSLYKLYIDENFNDEYKELKTYFWDKFKYSIRFYKDI